jgi:hypothetical protein
MYKTRSRNIQRQVDKHGRRRGPKVRTEAKFPQVRIEGVFRRWFHTEQEIWIVKPKPKSQPIFLKGRAYIGGLTLGDRVKLRFIKGEWYGEKISNRREATEREIN